MLLAAQHFSPHPPSSPSTTARSAVFALSNLSSVFEIEMRNRHSGHAGLKKHLLGRFAGSSLEWNLCECSRALPQLSMRTPAQRALDPSAYERS